MENNDQKEQKQAQSQQNTSTAPIQGKKNNTALIIILCVVGVLVLGIGGWYGYKYLQNKSSKQDTSSTQTSQNNATNVSTVLDLLMYPNATVTEQREEEDSVYKAELYLATTDSVDTIKSYYQSLVTKNNWKITTQGSVDTNNYYATIQGNNFTAEVECTKYEGYDTTDLSIKISGDNLVSDGIAVSSTSSSPSNSDESTSTFSKTGDYIISDSDTRVISDADLTDLTPWQLKVARNEIYARHGREFVHEDLQCYFAKKSWYSIDPNFTESMLSTTENKNVATIKAYEDATSSPLANKDSGCDTNQ